MSKKRANGEGSIRKRKDGRWEGRYTAGYDKDGKVITKNVLGKTQAEVKEKLKTAIEESQKLDPTRTGQYTVQTWVTLWYEVFIKPQIRPNTKQFYRNCMENHLFPALGDCPLEKLSTIQIQRAINEMSEHGRKSLLQPHSAERNDAQPTHCARHPRHPAEKSRSGRRRKAHSEQSGSKLQSPENGTERDESAAGRTDRAISARSEAARCVCAALSGTDQRPAPGRTAGPALERSEREGPNAFRYQKRLPHRPSACCQPAKNEKFPALADTSGEHRADSGGRTRKAPGQSLYVPVSENRRNARPGILPRHA